MAVIKEITYAFNVVGDNVTSQVTVDGESITPITQIKASSSQVARLRFITPLDTTLSRDVSFLYNSGRTSTPQTLQIEGTAEVVYQGNTDTWNVYYYDIQESILAVVGLLTSSPFYFSGRFREEDPLFWGEVDTAGELPDIATDPTLVDGNFATVGTETFTSYEYDATLDSWSDLGFLKNQFIQTIPLDQIQLTVFPTVQGVSTTLTPSEIDTIRQWLIDIENDITDLENSKLNKAFSTYATQGTISLNDVLAINDAITTDPKNVTVEKVLEPTEKVANKVSVINGVSETEYPNEKAVADYVQQEVKDNFIDLDDTPTDYTDDKFKHLRVKEDETGLEFVIPNNNSSTGVISGCIVTVNGGGSTLDISSGVYIVVDDTTDPTFPKSTRVVYAGDTNVTVPNLTVNEISYVSFNGTTGTLIFQDTEPSSSQRRNNPLLARIFHPDKATISAIVASPVMITQPLQTAVDYHAPVDLKEGLGVSGVTGAQSIFNNAGKLVGIGINSVNDQTDPNILSVSDSNPTTFTPIYRDALGGLSVGSPTTIFDPSLYDDGSGTLASIPLPNSNSVNHRVYIGGSGTWYIFYGQNIYSDLDSAQNAYLTGADTFDGVSDEFLRNIVPKAILTAQRNATDFSDTAQVKIINIAGTGGGSGASGSGGVEDSNVSITTGGDFISRRGSNQKSVNESIDTDVVQAEADIVQAQADILVLQETVDSTQTEQTYEAVTESTSGVITPRKGLAQFVEAQGLTLNQDLSNGDFSNGTTDWTSLGGSTSAINVNDNLENTGNGGSSVAYIQQSFNNVDNNKFFIKTRVRVTNTLCTQIDFGNTGFDEGYISQLTPVQNQWYEISGIVTGSATSNEILVLQRYANATDQNGAVMEVDYVVTIPITNTPLSSKSASELNDIIPTYFEGIEDAIFNLTSTTVDNTETLSFKENGNNVLLRSVGTIRDKIKEVDNEWYVERNVGKDISVVKNATWFESGTTGTTLHRYFIDNLDNLLPDMKVPASDGAVANVWLFVDNDTYYPVSENDIDTPAEIDARLYSCAVNSTGNLYVVSNEATASAFMTYLSNATNVFFYYELTTSTDTLLDKDGLVVQDNPTTLVQNGTFGTLYKVLFTIDLGGQVDTTVHNVQNLDKQMTDVEDRVDTLESYDLDNRVDQAEIDIQNIEAKTDFITVTESVDLDNVPEMVVIFSTSTLPETVTSGGTTRTLIGGETFSAYDSFEIDVDTGTDDSHLTIKTHGLSTSTDFVFCRTIQEVVALGVTEYVSKIVVTGSNTFEYINGAKLTDGAFDTTATNLILREIRGVKH